MVCVCVLTFQIVLFFSFNSDYQMVIDAQAVVMLPMLLLLVLLLLLPKTNYFILPAIK